MDSRRRGKSAIMVGTFLSNGPRTRARLPLRRSWKPRVLASTWSSQSRHTAPSNARLNTALFLGLAFATFFLFESISAVRLNALNYLLVGAALCLFYLG